MNTVPKKISASLAEFCKTISIERPRYIPSKPNRSALLSACFQNVHQKVEAYGGQLCCGWLIWTIPNLYYEAEFHGVWRNDKGHFLDVSPQMNKVKKIMFLPDFSAVYDADNCQTNRFEVAKNNAPSLKFVELARERNSIINRYRRGEYLDQNYGTADSRRLDEISTELQNIITDHGH